MSDETKDTKNNVIAFPKREPDYMEETDQAMDISFGMAMDLYDQGLLASLALVYTSSAIDAPGVLILSDTNEDSAELAHQLELLLEVIKRDLTSE